MKQVYMSDDGRVFDNENECMNYEMKNVSVTKLKGLEFYDENGAPMPKEYESLKTCQFINIKDEAAGDVIELWGEYTDIPVPSKNGLSRWDADDGCWISCFDDFGGWLKVLPLVRDEVNRFI